MTKLFTNFKKYLIDLGKLDRRYIFLLIGLSVLIPLIKPNWINIPIKTTNNSQIVFNELNKLNEGDKVLTIMTNVIEKNIKNFYIARFFYHLNSNSFQSI